MEQLLAPGLIIFLTTLYPSCLQPQTVTRTVPQGLKMLRCKGLALGDLVLSVGRQWWKTTPNPVLRLLCMASSIEEGAAANSED